MSYLVITEREKFDILKRYGLLVEQEEFYYDSLGKKYPQTDNKPTPNWSFSNTLLPTSKIVEINFPFNKTKKVIVNDIYNLDNRHFRNINNKVGINVPNTITISSIKVVETNNNTHNFKKE